MVSSFGSLGLVSFTFFLRSVSIYDGSAIQRLYCEWRSNCRRLVQRAGHHIPGSSQVLQLTAKGIFLAGCLSDFRIDLKHRKFMHILGCPKPLFLWIFCMDTVFRSCPARDHSVSLRATILSRSLLEIVLLDRLVMLRLLASLIIAAQAKALAQNH